MEKLNVREEKEEKEHIGRTDNLRSQTGYDIITLGSLSCGHPRKIWQIEVEYFIIECLCESLQCKINSIQR